MPKNSLAGYILVDRHYETPRCTWARTSLWKSFLRTVGAQTKIHFAQVSISDRKRAQKPKTVRIDSATVVIVNWDAANGDYICGSDDVFLYFQTRGDRRDALLRSGGKLLCEFQSGKGVLHQGAYDAIFGRGEVEVQLSTFPAEIVRHGDCAPEFVTKRKEEEEKWTNVSAHPNLWFKSFHPILEGLGPVQSKYTSTAPLYNFDESARQEGFFWYRHGTQGCTFHGWFASWQKEWIPLLLADVRDPGHRWKWLFRPPPAILLAKCMNGGIMLASTMWMAVPGMEPLVRRILDTDVKEIAKVHASYRNWRRVTDTAWLFLFSLAFWKLRTIFPNSAHYVLQDLGLFWGGLIAFRLWKHLFWRRPFGMNVLRFASRGFKSFLDTI